MVGHMKSEQVITLSIQYVNIFKLILISLTLFLIDSQGLTPWHDYSESEYDAGLISDLWYL